jgi:hypothetical protein
MTGARIERRALARRAPRGAALPLLGALLLEARDAKEAIEDEVDDRT